MMSAVAGESMASRGERARQWVLAALPNTVTILALCAGLSGLTFVMSGDFERAIACVLAAGLMVSRVPTFSGKLIGRIASLRWFVPSLLLPIGVMGLLIADLWSAAALIASAYLLTIPLSAQRFQMFLRHSI